MTVIIEDSFDDLGDTDELSGRAPDVTNTPGNTWTENAFGAWTGDGSGGLEAIGTSRWCHIDTNITDDAMSADVDFNARGGDNRFSIIIISDGSDDDNSYYMNVRDTTVHLFEKIAASSTELASTSQSRNQSTTYNYKIEHDPSASTLKCYRDDTEITGLTQTSFSPDAALTGNQFCGLKHNAYTGSGGVFDNFIVDDLAGGAAASINSPLLLLGVG